MSLWSFLGELLSRENPQPKLTHVPSAGPGHPNGWIASGEGLEVWGDSPGRAAEVWHVEREAAR